MDAIVSIIMGSTSDLPVMEKACKFLDEMQIPFEVNALSAHRTPDAVEAFAKGAKARGIKVIIAAAGMAAVCVETFTHTLTMAQAICTTKAAIKTLPMKRGTCVNAMK